LLACLLACFRQNTFHNFQTNGIIDHQQLSASIPHSRPLFNHIFKRYKPFADNKSSQEWLKPKDVLKTLKNGYTPIS